MHRYARPKQQLSKINACFFQPLAKIMLDDASPISKHSRPSIATQTRHGRTIVSRAALFSHAVGGIAICCATRTAIVPCCVHPSARNFLSLKRGGGSRRNWWGAVMATLCCEAPMLPLIASSLIALRDYSCGVEIPPLIRCIWGR